MNPALLFRRLLCSYLEFLAPQLFNQAVSKIRTVYRGEQFVGLRGLRQRDLMTVLALEEPDRHAAANQVRFKSSVRMIKRDRFQVFPEAF